MITNDDFQKAVELINNSQSILITTHTRPDGDACGSVAAMTETLTAAGKNARPILLSPLPEWYEFLFAEKPAVLGDDVTLEQLKAGTFFKPDLIIIIDTNSYNQLPKFTDYLKQKDCPILIIDHHVTSDGLGDVELVEPAAAAAGLIIFDLFKYAGWQMSPKVTEALFVAIATDTGWFKFTNTNARVHRSCAELIDASANPTSIYHDLYQNFSHQRFKLMASMLDTLELHFGGRYAVQHIAQPDFRQTGAAHKDTENLIDECQRISTVEVAALFVELADGRIKCSLRSSCGVDVRKIAAKFGGGGHTMAAGVHLPGPLKNAKQIIFAHLAEQFAQIDGK